MKKEDKKKLYELAKRIKKAGRDIAADHIAKDYHLAGIDVKDGIVITSDSGYEAITIGKIYGRKGYMYLFTNCPDKRNSFPETKELAMLLGKVVNKELLPEGNGKAAYHRWKEYGSIEKQLKYYSQIVCKMAGIVNDYGLWTVLWVEFTDDDIVTNFERLTSKKSVDEFVAELNEQGIEDEFITIFSPEADRCIV